MSISLVKPTLAIHLPTYSPGGCDLLRLVCPSRTTVSSPFLKSESKAFSSSAPNTPVHNDIMPSGKLPSSVSFSDSRRTSLKYVRHFSINSNQNLINLEFSQNHRPVTNAFTYNNDLINAFNEADETTSIQHAALSGVASIPKLVDEYSTLKSSDNYQTSNFQTLLIFHAKPLLPCYTFVCLLSIFSFLWYTLRTFSDSILLLKLRESTTHIQCGVLFLILCLAILSFYLHMTMTWTRTSSRIMTEKHLQK